MSEVESSLRSGQSGKFAVESSKNMPDESLPTERESSLDDHFSDEEIRAQLQTLGYENVPDYQLRLFKADLERLLWYDQQKTDREAKSTEEGEEKAEVSEAESSARSSKHSSRKTARAPFTSYMQTGSDKKAMMPRRKQRLQLCEDMGLDFERRSPSPLTSESSRTSGKHRWHRRKVLRHINGIPTVCEESLTDADDMSVLSEQLSSLSVEEPKKKKTRRSRSYTWAPDCPIVNAVLCKDSHYQKRPSTATAFGKKKKKITKEDYYDEIVRYLPKAFVDNPDGIQPLKKTNPNERFNMYRKMWDHYRIPGESPDLELRWCIRALLLTKRLPDIQTYALKRKEAIDNAKRMKEHKSWT